MAISDQDELHRLRSEDVLQGRILWLPTFNEASTTWKLRDPTERLPAPVVRHGRSKVHPHRKFYSHPILVLSRSADRPNIIHFLPMTTFDGTPIEEALDPTGWRKPEWYLPMGERTSHPRWNAQTGQDPNYQPLLLRANRQTANPGYVCANKVWAMDWRDAEQDWAAARSPEGHLELTTESLEQVLRATCDFAQYMPRPQYQAPATELPEILPRPSNDVSARSSATERLSLLPVQASRPQISSPVLPLPFRPDSAKNHPPEASSTPVLSDGSQAHRIERQNRVLSSSGGCESNGFMLLAVLYVAVAGLVFTTAWSSHYRKV